MRSLCVFCGSSSGNLPVYHETGTALGKWMAKEKVRFIYGGAHVGLMGSIANACLADGGVVTGIIPEFLTGKEILHPGLTETIIVTSMHERKLLMYEQADAFIMLPGGFGTMDEFFEILTWAQLSLHHKPIAILNIQGYYNFMEKHFDQMEEIGFIRKEHRKLFHIASEMEEALAYLQRHVTKDAGNIKGIENKV